ncbi:MAG TPA: iron ABC transporter permease [Ligilactobacillus acidipiscis]|uniref:Iron ABC transporter permease n=1 Tax=Ligilactobacillus acidipiscis TaxID=89059 RepID=A0A921K1A5_9LACO|nr:iron ABC transporter permease [Ligilactobacillus acidipiscis]
MMDENNSSSKKFVGSQRRKIRRFLSVGILGVVLLGLIIFSLLYGRTIYSISEVSQVILGRFVPGASFTILTLRLPRMIAAVLAGFSFGIAGYVFQTMLRNPLANPDILGISSGSSCAVVVCILVFHTSQMTRSFAAVCAGLLTVIILFGLSGHKRVAATRIIIVGIGLQAFYNAIISYLTVTGDQRDLPEALRWLNGSLDSVTLAQLPILAVVVLISVPICIYFGKRLSVIKLGDELALSLGVNVNATKLVLFGVTILMSAMATAVTGPIAFVSFLAGPLTDKIMGKNGNNIIAAGLVGALLVMLSDMVGQFAFPYRFPVGVVTGLIGAPYLIWQLMVINKRGGYDE